MRMHVIFMIFMQKYFEGGGTFTCYKTTNDVSIYKIIPAVF